ncbi:MAG: hypothetical protein IT374_17535 [Polyangiaceae bacterium]|nr:hypothetical protein [Polyangiaceae bacterium]
MTKPKYAPVCPGDRLGDVVALARCESGWRWRCPCGAEFTAEPTTVRAWERKGGARCARCFYVARVESVASAVPEEHRERVEGMIAEICATEGVRLAEGATLAERAAVVPGLSLYARRVAVGVLALFARKGVQS